MIPYNTYRCKRNQRLEPERGEMDEENGARKSLVGQGQAIDRERTGWRVDGIML